MKYILPNLVLIAFLFGANSLSAQRKIESSKVVFIEQEGDSVFCREKEILFEVLDFEFDSCNFYNNKFYVTFRLINKTKYTILLSESYISWYDTGTLRPISSAEDIVRPNQSTKITLESVPYSKRRMNSPGDLLIIYEDKQMKIPMRLKQETSKVKQCIKDKKQDQ